MLPALPGVPARAGLSRPFLSFTAQLQDQVRLSGSLSPSIFQWPRLCSPPSALAPSSVSSQPPAFPPTPEQNLKCSAALRGFTWPAVTSPPLWPWRGHSSVRSLRSGLRGFLRHATSGSLRSVPCLGGSSRGHPNDLLSSPSGLALLGLLGPFVQYCNTSPSAPLQNILLSGFIFLLHFPLTCIVFIICLLSDPHYNVSFMRAGNVFVCFLSLLFRTVAGSWHTAETQ